MYTTVRTTPESTPSLGLSRPVRVSLNVVLLGLTSLFTDISQEMVTAVLPIYLTFELRLSPLQFGIVDGLYQGASALVRLVGGLIADRRARYKEVAATGYALSAACKAGLVVAGGAWLPVTGLLFVDRIGKGIRTTPRDALISLSSEPERLGNSFGVHRALDTLGALIGPLIAFAMLVAIPFAFDAIFVVSLASALIGLGILVLFVQNKTGSASPEERRSVSFRRALGLLREPAFRRIVSAGSLLALLTIGDGFLYLVLQRKAAMPARWFPLLFLGTAAVYLALAIPLGRLADRVGRPKVFVAGYGALLGAYLVLLTTAPTGWLVLGCLALQGTYYAATDGVLMAMTSAIVEPSMRTSGLGVVTTVVSLSRFVASVTFRRTVAGARRHLPIALFAAGLGVALPIAWRTLQALKAMRTRARLALFAVLCVVCVVAARAYVVHAAGRDRATPTRGRIAGQAPDAVQQIVDAPYIVFRSTALDDGYGRAAVVPIDDPGGERAYTDLVCDRVDVAGGRGVCLSTDSFLGGMRATVFDDRFRAQGEIAAPGSPSRTRVAPDGRLAAYTTFVAGHSYADVGFSTRTVLVDLASAREIGSLERFDTFRNGERFSRVDFNFWGVTFAGRRILLRDTRDGAGGPTWSTGDAASQNDHGRPGRDRVPLALPRRGPHRLQATIRRRLRAGHVASRRPRPRHRRGSPSSRRSATSTTRWPGSTRTPSCTGSPETRGARP